MLRRLFQWGILLIGVLLAVSLVNSVFSELKVKNEINSQQERLEELKNKNQELKTNLEAVKSDAFIEKIARDKLGLAKEGETVVVLPSEEILKQISPQSKEEEESLPDPNWKKWLKVFFR